MGWPRGWTPAEGRGIISESWCVPKRRDSDHLSRRRDNNCDKQQPKGLLRLVYGLTNERDESLPSTLSLITVAESKKSGEESGNHADSTVGAEDGSIATTSRQRKIQFSTRDRSCRDKRATYANIYLNPKINATSFLLPSVRRLR